MLKSFDIVIVNWNSGSQLKECIDSIQKADKSQCSLEKIIVVDNASSDNSIALLSQNVQNLKIIQNDENLGFGKACNQGAFESKSEFILFLNPDMLVYETTFLNLFEYIKMNAKAEEAIYGVQLLDEEKNIQKSCARFPTLWSFTVRSLGLNKLNSKVFKSYTMEDWKHENTQNVNQVIGAFFMVKREIFEKLNGFDERYFVYYEELDFSKRVHALGYKTLYVTESQAYHKGGGTSEQVKAKRLFYNLRSRMIYAFKHFGVLQGFVTLFLTLFIEPTTRVVFLLLKGKFSEVFESFRGFFMLYKDIFNIIDLGLKK